MTLTEAATHAAEVEDLVGRSKSGFIIMSADKTQVSLGGPIVGEAGPDDINGAFANLLACIINPADR